MARIVPWLVTLVVVLLQLSPCTANGLLDNNLALPNYTAPCPCIGKEQLKLLREERKRLVHERLQGLALLNRLIYARKALANLLQIHLPNGAGTNADLVKIQAVPISAPGVTVDNEDPGPASETYHAPPPMEKHVVPSSQTTAYDVAPPHVASGSSLQRPHMKVTIGHSPAEVSETYDAPPSTEKHVVSSSQTTMSDVAPPDVASGSSLQRAHVKATIGHSPVGVSETYHAPPPMEKHVVPSSQTTMFDVAPPDVASGNSLQRPNKKVTIGHSTAEVSKTYHAPPPTEKHVVPSFQTTTYDVVPPPLSSNQKPRIEAAIGHASLPAPEINRRKPPKAEMDGLETEKKKLVKLEEEVLLEQIELSLKEDKERLATEIARTGGNSSVTQEKARPGGEKIHARDEEGQLQNEKKLTEEEKKKENEVTNDLIEEFGEEYKLTKEEKEAKKAPSGLLSTASLLTFSPSPSATTSTAAYTTSASPSASITTTPSASIAPSPSSSITSLPSASITPTASVSIYPSPSLIPSVAFSPSPTSSLELPTPTPSTSASQSLPQTSPLTSLGNFNLESLFQDAQQQIGNVASSQEKSAKENAQNAQQKQDSTPRKRLVGPVTQLVDRGNLLAESSSESKTQNSAVSVTDSNTHTSNQVATEAANEAVENVLQAAKNVSYSSYMGKQIAEILKDDEAGARNEAVAIDGDLANSTNGNASIINQKENMNAERETLAKELDQLDTEPKNIRTRLRRLVIVLDMARYDHRIMMLEQQMKLNAAELAWLKKEVSESQRSDELSKNQQTLNEQLRQAPTDQQKKSLMEQLSAIQDELSWLLNQSKSSHASRGEDEVLHQRLIFLKKTRKAKDAELIVLDEKLRTKFANETGNSSISDALIANRTMLANEIAQLRKEELDVQAKRLEIQGSTINAVYQPCDAACLEKRAAADAAQRERDLLALEAKKARDKLAEELRLKRLEEARKWREKRRRLHERNIERKGLGYPTIPYTPVLTVRKLPNTIEGVEAELKLNAMKMVNETNGLTNAKSRNDPASYRIELIQAYEKRVQIIADRQERLNLHLENLRKEIAARIEEEKRKQDLLAQLSRDGLITIEDSGNISLPETLPLNFTTENGTVTSANFPMDVSGVTEGIKLLNSTVKITMRELSEARRKQDSYMIEKLKIRIQELVNRRMQLTTLLEKLIEDEKQREKERQDAITRTMNERLLRIKQLEQNNSDLAELHSELKSKQSQEKQKIVKCFKDTIVNGTETSTEVPCDSETASTHGTEHY